MRSTQAALRQGPADGHTVTVDAWPYHYDAGKPVTRILVAVIPDLDGTPRAHVLGPTTTADVLNRAYGGWVNYRLHSTDPVEYVIDGDEQP